MIGSFPNPALTDVNIVYALCRDSDVRAEIYTETGEKVRTLRSLGTIGRNVLYWDCRNNRDSGVGSGVFIYSMEAISGIDRTKKWGKLVVVR